MIRWPWKQPPERLRLAPGTRIYAIGDIHGRSDLLAEMMARIDQDRATRREAQVIEIYLGDYIDRGSDSRSVIDLLLARRSQFPSTVCLRGNHDELLIDFLEARLSLGEWLTYDAAETLRSYGVSFDPANPDASSAKIREALQNKMPSDHLNFLFGLPYSHENGDYFFVHAGIRPNIPLAEQRRSDLIWIRREFLDSPRRHEKMIVHGHTPVSEPEILPNRINIDTGAVLTGRLTCLVLDGDEMSFL